MLLGVLVGTLLAACTGTESTPATTPTMTAPTTTVPITTTTAPPPATSAPDRLAEIQAIFQDLEERRLDALYRGDVDAFSALFANEAYLEQDLQSFDLVEFIAAPDSVMVEVTEILVDEGQCVAANVRTDFSSALGAEAKGSGGAVIEYKDGKWGYSWVGNGWVCEGQHPLDS
jgi:hypothetical protein